MKTIALIVAFTTSISAFAITTKNCPQKVSVDLPKIYQDDIINDVDSEDDSTFPYDGWNGPGVIALQKRLNELKALKLDFELQNTANSTCTYYGVDQNGDFASAKLSGSTRANAIKPATLQFFALKSLAGYIMIESVSVNGLVQKGQFAELYYRGEYCSYGDCIPDHINIGRATSYLQ